MAQLLETVLAELHLAAVHTDETLRVVSTDLAPGGYILLDRDPRGASLVDLFPELIGCEAELVEVAHGRAPRFELPMINRSSPEAQPRYFSLVALPCAPVGEGAAGITLLVRDVSAEGRLHQTVMQQLNEMRLLRAQLEAANARLVRLDAEKSAFLRMAAHDLRAPLTIIRGYVELVLQGGGTPPGDETAEYLGIVLNRAGQMARLIDDLLDVEKIESGSARLRLRPVDIGALVAQVTAGFEPLARERGLSLSRQVAPDMPHPPADADRVGQVINNLVSNALKFTPPGGRVTVEAFRRDQEVVVEVADTGPGIAEADQQRLFDRFFRTDDARRQRIPGSGLGLSIVRALVEQHGGRVYCRSQTGQGSTLGFTLPCHPLAPVRENSPT